MSNVQKLKFAWKYRKYLWKYREVIRHRREIAGLAAVAIGVLAAGIYFKDRRIEWTRGGAG